MESPNDRGSTARSANFEARAAALRARVGEAAQAVAERGLKPTVARIRAALGGGSPNDLAPALKSWRETARAEDPAAAPQQQGVAHGRIPPPIADLAQELWQRALAAATLDLQHGPAARRLTAKTAEADSLRTQLNTVRQQLEREALVYGELRAQAARHEALARHALARAEQAEGRVRDLLREVGEARQKIAQLAAELQQRKAASPAASPRGRHSAQQPQRIAFKSRRVKRTSPARAVSSPPRQAKTKSRTGMAKSVKSRRRRQS